jgi:tRNA G18 (ribose-2'-O)-methylase SpoU
VTDQDTQAPLTRSQRKAERQERQRQIEQRYRKARQRNVMAQPGPNQFAFVLDNLKAGYNVPKIFRSTQAFGGAEVHLVNIGVFDPAPAKGAFRKVPARFHDAVAPAIEDLQSRGYTLYAMTANAEHSLPQTRLAEKSAFIIGHEETGLSFDPADFPGVQTLAIPLYGEMESLNASVAASIAMYEYTRQHGK